MALQVNGNTGLGNPLHFINLTFLGEERAEEEKPESCAQEHNSDNLPYILFAKNPWNKNIAHLFFQFDTDVEHAAHEIQEFGSKKIMNLRLLVKHMCLYCWPFWDTSYKLAVNS